MIDIAELEDYLIEVDSRHDGQVWFTLWHENCGQFLVEDYAKRMQAPIRELVGLATAHSIECDR